MQHGEGNQMRNATAPQSMSRRATRIVALTVIMLGATSANAIAAPTGFDKSSLSFDASGDKQTLLLSTTEGGQVTGPATLVGPGGSGAAPAGFSVPTDQCGKDATVAKPNSISSSGCKVGVKFNGSTKAGAQLTIDTTKGKQTVLLRANAPKATVCAAGSTTCGASVTLPAALSTTVGTSRTQTFDIVNGGPDGSAKAPLAVDSVAASAPYSADVSGCATVAAGARCTVTVTFNPTAAGSFPATLTVNSDDPITPGPSVSIAGTAEAASVAPAPTPPGTVPPGTVPPSTGSKPATPKPGSKPAAATKRASVTGFKFSAQSIAPGGEGKFRYTLAAPARVTITIARKVPGKAVKYISRGSIVVTAAKVGKNTTKFSGRLKGRKLPVGAYRATITTRNAAGTAARRFTTFIVKAKRG